MSNERILIRSSLAQWPAYLLGSIGVVLVVAGIVLATMLQLEPLGIALGVGGIVLVISAFFIEAHRVKQLMWVTLEDHRFTITDNIGDRSFNDDDIVSIALKYKENFENGVLKSVTRTFRIWNVSHADQPELIEMATTLRQGARDPLQTFIERIIRLLKERAYTERASGHSVLGEKWVLDGKKLLLRDPQRGEVETTLAEIIAADYIDNNLKLWRSGQDDCLAELPHDSANCHLLKVLLDDELAGRPPLEDKERIEGQLGRIIFERRPPRGAGWVLLILAGVALMGGLGLLAASFDPANFKDAIVMRIFGSILPILAVGLGLGGWYSLRSIFRCQAYGVYQQTLGSEKSLRFEEMAAFTYTTVRHHTHFDLPTFVLFLILRSLKQETGTTTQLKMVFHPNPETRKRKIVYGTSVRNVNTSFEAMRDYIAGMLAPPLIQALRAGQSVEWTPKFTLTPEGLRYTPAGLFTSKAPELLSYNQISGRSIDQKTFTVYRYGLSKPVVTESISARNFFPGYLAFQALLSEAQRTPRSAELETASE